MKSILLLIVCSIVASVVDSQELITLNPQYDDATSQLRIFTVHRSLILSCTITPTALAGNAELSWSRDGKDVREDSQLEGRFQILAAEHKFVIDRTVADDHGIYACELGTNKAIFNVVANVASRLPRDTQLIEGESLWIVCRVVGTTPKVSWILPNNSTITNSTGHIILERENDIANSALYIASIRLEDRGNYTCIAENAASTVVGFEPSVSTAKIRVRSKLAPLWPVCGILVQCFVLFVILFIYEKFFHEKEELLENDDDYEVTPQDNYKTKAC